jgi:hypothetical protein
MYKISCALCRCLLIVVLALSPAVAVADDAKQSSQTYALELGVVSDATQAIGTIEINNESESQWVLQEAGKDASILSVMPGKVTIPPKESRQIRVVVNNINKLGEVSGRIVFKPVDDNAGNVPIITINVACVVKKVFLVSPQKPDLGEVRQGESAKGKFAITSTDQTPFQITNVETTSKVFLPAIVKDEPGTIEFQSLPNVQPGRYFDPVVVTTDSKLQPTVTVWVTGHVIGPLKPKRQLEAMLIDVGVENALETPRDVVIELENTQQQAPGNNLPKITKVLLDDIAIDFHAVPSNNGYTLTLKSIMPGKNRTKPRKITIQLDNALGTIITIPLIDSHFNQKSRKPGLNTI